MGRFFLFFLAAGLLLTLTASATPVDKIHPALRAKMLAADEFEFIPINIRLTEEFDTYAFMDRTMQLSWMDRRALLIKEASAFAAERQNSILDGLKEAEAAGHAKNTLNLWIVNMVHTRIQKGLVEQFAALYEVQEISWDRPYKAEELHDSIPGGGDGADAISWSVEKIQAPDVWALGFTGQDVVVANLDSGSDYTHPDLKDHIWKNPGEIPNNGIDDDNNGFVDDTMGWDFENNDNDPQDSGGHGTQTAGIVCGDGTKGTQTGVAPDAHLMILRIGGEALHMAGQQYAIENGAHVATSSYSYKWYFSPKPNYHAFRDASVKELAASLFHTNSTSNSGTSVGVPWNVSAPALCPSPWLDPAHRGIGGVAGTLGIGGSEQDDTHYSPSPTGPSAWEDIKKYDPGYPHSQNPNYWDYPYNGSTKKGLMKPDVACPTGGVPSTTMGGGYTSSFSGTSAATPHGGGAACLLVSANPLITPEKICQALKVNAKDLGSPGLDVLFGSGRINVYEAVINVLTPLLADNKNPPLGSTVTLDLEGPAGKAYVILLSLDLGKSVIPGVLTLDIAPPFLIMQQGALDGAGQAQLKLPLPKKPSFSGIQLHFQSIVDDTLGATGLYLVSLHETVTLQ